MRLLTEWIKQTFESIANAVGEKRKGLSSTLSFKKSSFCKLFTLLMLNKYLLMT